MQGWQLSVGTGSTCRVLRKIPDMIESFVDKAADLLNDRNHAVLLSGAEGVMRAPAVVQSWQCLMQGDAAWLKGRTELNAGPQSSSWNSRGAGAA